MILESGIIACDICRFSTAVFKLNPFGEFEPHMDACSRHLAKAIRVYKYKPCYVRETVLTKRRQREEKLKLRQFDKNKPKELITK